MEIVTITKSFCAPSSILRDDACGFLLRWTSAGLLVECCEGGSVLSYDDPELQAVNLEQGKIIDWSVILQGRRETSCRVGDSSMITCVVESDADRILKFIKTMDGNERWTLVERLYIEHPTLNLVEQICQMEGLTNKGIWNKRRKSLMVRSMLNASSNNRETLSQLTTGVKLSNL